MWSRAPQAGKNGERSESHRLSLTSSDPLMLHAPQLYPHPSTCPSYPACCLSINTHPACITSIIIQYSSLCITSSEQQMHHSSCWVLLHEKPTCVSLILFLWIDEGQSFWIGMKSSTFGWHFQSFHKKEPQTHFEPPLPLHFSKQTGTTHLCGIQ